jgi:hypothetical protein
MRDPYLKEVEAVEDLARRADETLVVGIPAHQRNKSTLAAGFLGDDFEVLS